MTRITQTLLTIALLVLATRAAGQTSVNWTAGVEYRYDGSGNIRAVGTDVNHYDAFGRLVQSGVKGLRQSYTYDRFGNRLTCTSNGGDCQYGLTANSNTNRLDGVTYDAAGNATVFMNHTYDYDAVNMVKRDIGSPTREFVYTADDERLAQYDLSTAVWRWTVREAGGKVLRELTSQGGNAGGAIPGSLSWQWSRDYIYRDGGLLASRQRNPGTGALTTFHYHLDHLGTPRRITDDENRIVGVHDYHAFGPETSGGTNEWPVSRLKFTGHERDLALTGEAADTLDYMHARYYSGAAGRFLAVDPVMDIAKASRAPQQWNRYSYVANDPVRYVDPGGMLRVRAYNTGNAGSTRPFLYSVTFENRIGMVGRGGSMFAKRFLGPLKHLPGIIDHGADLLVGKEATTNSKNLKGVEAIAGFWDTAKFEGRIQDAFKELGAESVAGSGYYDDDSLQTLQEAIDTVLTEMVEAGEITQAEADRVREEYDIERLRDDAEQQSIDTNPTDDY
jgi:RHS repeat-associated protein